jgi:hypothetical protein
MVKNRKNCEPHVSHALDDLRKFIKAPFRGSVVGRDNGDHIDKCLNIHI